MSRRQWKHVAPSSKRALWNKSRRMSRLLFRPLSTHPGGKGLPYTSSPDCTVIQNNGSYPVSGRLRSDAKRSFNQVALKRIFSFYRKICSPSIEKSRSRFHACRQPKLPREKNCSGGCRSRESTSIAATTNKFPWKQYPEKHACLDITCIDPLRKCSGARRTSILRNSGWSEPACF